MQPLVAGGDRLGTLADDRSGLRGLVDVDAELPEVLSWLLAGALEDVASGSAESGQLLGESLDRRTG
ncbi:hypothetical protein DEI99_006605 [Curtobacterium sp. MCLR17_036]|uniref:hypothetical protein n=1 Tax=Curtobacterium sp. MCLR17_036 TaxID=2175620 RepID=UPI0011B65B60|nr:hypothetical protein [Curtobacterium sp. MCLR17_036]WIE66198.1 hypothetical protein DEI99_006605 [Curtobacterium sp. MCLR17_036]